MNETRFYVRFLEPILFRVCRTNSFQLETFKRLKTLRMATSGHLARYFQAQPFQSRGQADPYASFLTLTFTFAAISRCNFTGTSKSPTTLIGSASAILRFSTLKPFAASASEISADVTE